MRDSKYEIRNNKYEPLVLVFSALGGIVLLFIVAPLASMFLSCSLPELAETAKDSEVQSSIWLTLWTSMAATMLFAIAAIPFSYVLARKDFPLKGLVTAIIDLPIVIPHSAAGIALLGIVSKNGALGKAATELGFSFVGTPAGIMAAMAFVSIPYLINSARDGFLAVPVRLEKAALNLGASPLRVFLTVSVPLAWRSILSGLILMWARGMSEFGAVLIIAYHPMITPVLIYERFGAFGLKYARPVAVLFIVVCLVFLAALRLLAGGKNNAQR
jgi:molybdate/tungstate transport system permease protein